MYALRALKFHHPATNNFNIVKSIFFMVVSDFLLPLQGIISTISYCIR